MARSVNHDLMNAIPMLRRYAYCLTGSGHVADDLIERALQDIVEMRAPLKGSSVTLSLFKIFNLSCYDAGFLGHLRLVDGDQSLLSRVLDLPIEDRKALLLVRTMGFTDAEAGEILCLPEEDVRRSRHSAGLRLLGSSLPLTTDEQQQGIAS